MYLHIYTHIDTHAHNIHINAHTFFYIYVFIRIHIGQYDYKIRQHGSVYAKRFMITFMHICMYI
jgi:hypothetical protein